VLAWLLTTAIRLLAATWRVEHPGRAPLERSLASGPVVIALRHGDLLPLVALHRGLPLVGLVSQSKDGELATAVARRLGYGVIRGSTSQGALAAVRQAERTVRAGDSPAFAVDGPRGPAGVPHGGALAVSRVSGAPVWWARAHANPAWRLRSWDRFCVPLPFARIALSYGTLPPVGAGREGLEQAREGLQVRLTE
jgi:lysophospholipid acyltransferase (LPLAT)-like uncharacterized protein